MSVGRLVSPWAGPLVNHFSKHPPALAWDLPTCRGRSQEASPTWAPTTPSAPDTRPLEDLEPTARLPAPPPGAPCRSYSSGLFVLSPQGAT